jgi:hypothetical protein
MEKNLAFDEMKKANDKANDNTLGFIHNSK